jgi:two-component system LytT family sensor kinase
MNTAGNTQNNKFRLSLYWKCQFTGWGVVSLLWLYIALLRDQYTVFLAVTNYILDVAICIGLTHTYRTIALRAKWNFLNIKKLIRKVIPSILILAVLFMLIMNLKMSGYVYFVKNNNIFLENLFEWNPVLITGLRHMSIWVLAYHLYHFYIREVTTAKTNAKLSVIAKQAQFDNLSAQLNPHFLFNSLNSIKSLVIENPSTARRAIDLLSDLLRSSLYEKDKGLITIKEELALVQDYIELEKMRFEERLQLEITIDKTLENLKIPTLSIQLLVENAIKHGIDSKVEGGIINLSIEKKNNIVKITVQNPGTININKESSGLGLKNLQERLAIQYKGEATFKVTEIGKELVSAVITLPIKTDENI